MSGVVVVFFVMYEQDEFGEEVVFKFFWVEFESVFFGWVCKKLEGWSDDIILVDGCIELFGEFDFIEILQEQFEFEVQVFVDGELFGFEYLGIVVLFDVGYVEDGWVFVIMEYVEGDCFDEYCDQCLFGLLEWFEFFVQFCEVLQFVYLSLVIYGDFKLFFVLVDGVVCVCVFDIGFVEFFGIGVMMIFGCFVCVG